MTKLMWSAIWICPTLKAECRTSMILSSINGSNSGPEIYRQGKYHKNNISNKHIYLLINFKVHMILSKIQKKKNPFLPYLIFLWNQVPHIYKCKIHRPYDWIMEILSTSVFSLKGTFTLFQLPKGLPSLSMSSSQTIEKLQTCNAKKG